MPRLRHNFFNKRAAMMDKTYAIKISDRLNLSPYQRYILETNGEKYNLDHLQKRGVVLYAPYRCSIAKSPRDFIMKHIFGPRADLIGESRMLARDMRGLKIHATGFYSGIEKFHKFYADSNGARISKSIFDRVIG
jgi:hypothetical protein